MGIKKKDAKDFASTKHDGLPERKESMNFTEYCDAIEDVKPLYEKEGKAPMCPKGYKWNMKTMRCEPKTERDSVAGEKDGGGRGTHGYNVIGHTGYGDGWAFQTPPTNVDIANGWDN